MRTTLLSLLLITVLVLGASIGFFNAQPVTLNYLFGELQLPLFAVLIADFLIAVLLTLVVLSARMFRGNREIARLRRQLRDTESELRNLRNLPVTTELPPR